MHKSGFYFFFLFSLITSSCSNSSDPEQDKVYTCDEFDEIRSLFEELELDEDFIVSYADLGNYYELDFHLRESILISDDCIASFFERDSKSQVDIRFRNSELIKAAYKNIVDLDFKHNPNGKTPLSGVIQVNSILPGKLKFRIKNKDNSREDFEHFFDERSNKQQQPLLGLYYSNNNIIEISFYDETQIYYVDTFYVNIGQRPGFLPNIIVDVLDEDKVEPGMNLVSSRLRDPSSPFIVDNYGEYRYVLDFSSDPELSSLNYDVGMERLANGNYYFGKWPSNQLYEIDILGNIVNQWDLGEYEFHHNVQEKEDGNFLVTVSKYDMHASGGRAIEDWIIELDRNTGMIVNEWDLKESLDETRRVWGWWTWSDLVDWAHANAVIHDPSDNTIIVSCRTQCIVKLDQDNNVKWILSNHKDWGSNKKGTDLNTKLLQAIDQSGNIIEDPKVQEGEDLHPEFEWPWYQHAPFIAENGNLFVFDNGENRNFSSNAIYSRAVEYSIDEDNMTIQQIWQYGKERGSETYSRIVSDVDQLPVTGNIFFCPGSRVNNGGGNYGAKLVEIDYDTREPVFEMRINAPDIVFHRAERLSLYPN